MTLKTLFMRGRFTFRIISVVTLSCFLLTVYNWPMRVKHDSEISNQMDSSHSVFKTTNTDYERVAVNMISPSNKVLSHMTGEKCSFAVNNFGKGNVNTLNLYETVDRNMALVSPVADRDTGAGQKKTKPEPELAENEKHTFLDVILTPFSHNDPGWLKTVEAYFTDDTKHILDNMVEKLQEYPDMRFVWVETVFLSMWWAQTTSTKRSQLRKLVEDGRVEIAIGSWVMPDEASPHYVSLLDQLIEGHQWLDRHLGIKPQNSWAVDPFGYSSTMPYLYKRAGMENMAILRIHSNVKTLLVQKGAMEFYWRQPWESREQTSMFTHMMAGMLYDPSSACGPERSVCELFDFKHRRGDYHPSKFAAITESNVAEKANMLLDQYRKKSRQYQHNVLFVPLGRDFSFSNSVEWDQQYHNYSKLMRYINEHKELNAHMQFGTIKDYFWKVKEFESRRPIDRTIFPELEGDFFPYTDFEEEYWTGYFTTRPYYKVLGVDLEVYLRAAEILHTLATSTSLRKHESRYYENQNSYTIISMARQVLGLFMHHDSITGTSRRKVVANMNSKLVSAIDDIKKSISLSASYLLAGPLHDGLGGLKLSTMGSPSDMLLKPLDDILSVNEKVRDIVLYNSLPQTREQGIRLMVDRQYVKVVDQEGRRVPSQVNPTWTQSNTIDSSIYELVFIANLPPLSLVRYTLQNIEGTYEHGQTNNSNTLVNMYNIQDDGAKPELFDIENSQYKLTFNRSSGMLQSLMHKLSTHKVKTDIDMMEYNGLRSGAYIFYPFGYAKHGRLFVKPPIIRVLSGSIMNQVNVLDREGHIMHSVTLWNSLNMLGSAIEITNVVNVVNLPGTELVMRISTSMENTNTFFTDQNGFQTIRRKYLRHMPTEANYYPTTSHIYLEDAAGRLSLLSAQPLGAGIRASGEFEIMLHRNPKHDDGRGMAENLKKDKTAASRFYLIYEPKHLVDKEPPVNAMRRDANSFPTLMAHRLTDNLRNSAILLLSEKSPWPSVVPTQHHLLYSPMPNDVRLVNLRSLEVLTQDVISSSAALILHRVGFQCGYYGVNPDGDLDGRVEISNLFRNLRISNLEKKTLSLMHSQSKLAAEESVVLQPMEMYAYNITFH